MDSNLHHIYLSSRLKMKPKTIRPFPHKVIIGELSIIYSVTPPLGSEVNESFQPINSLHWRWRNGRVCKRSWARIHKIVSFNLEGAPHVSIEDGSDGLKADKIVFRVSLKKYTKGNILGIKIKASEAGFRLGPAFSN